MRRRLEDQLELEIRKIDKLETALRSLNYDTLVKVKESIAKEAAEREKEKECKSDRSVDLEKEKSASPPKTATSPSLASSPLTSGAEYHRLNYSMAMGRAMDRPLFPVNLPTSLPHSVSPSY